MRLIYSGTSLFALSIISFVSKIAPTFFPFFFNRRNVELCGGGENVVGGGDAGGGHMTARNFPVSECPVWKGSLGLGWKVARFLFFRSGLSDTGSLLLIMPVVPWVLHFPSISGGSKSLPREWGISKRSGIYNAMEISSSEKKGRTSPQSPPVLRESQDTLAPVLSSGQEMRLCPRPTLLPIQAGLSPPSPRRVPRCPRVPQVKAPRVVLYTQTQRKPN